MKTHIHFLEHPQIPESYLEGIDNSYEIEKELLIALAKHYSTKELENIHYSLNSFHRHQTLEQLEFYHAGNAIKPTDIATKNFKKMADITAAKWFFSLAYLIEQRAQKSLPIHHENGRVKIAIPGAWLGLEIGGILDFFNLHGIAIDIDAVDIRTAGEEHRFYDLEKRKALHGSTVSFHSHTDANTFFHGKKYDVVIFRNPGSIANPQALARWKKIINTLVTTGPELIVLTTYEFSLAHPDILSDTSDGTVEAVPESQVFKKVLSSHGFTAQSELSHDWLVYPISPYMIKPKFIDGELSFTWPVDRYMGLYSPNHSTGQAVTQSM